MQKVNNFFETHAPSIVFVGFLLAVGGYVLLTGLLSPGPNSNGAGGRSQPLPTASLTAQGFPAPGETVTQSHHVRRKDGSIAVRTVLEYRDAQNRIIRETVREPIPGVKITSTATVIAAGSTSTARETLVSQETIIGPGGTTTIAVPVTETVPGPTTTETVITTATETVTETVQGPDVPITETVTVTASP